MAALCPLLHALDWSSAQGRALPPPTRHRFLPSSSLDWLCDRAIKHIGESSVAGVEIYLAAPGQLDLFTE